MAACTGKHQALALQQQEAPIVQQNFGSLYSNIQLLAQGVVVISALCTD
jgi:hypothetical protein